MILSGRHVLLMDPSKAYLGKGRSCYKRPLEQMKKYVDHISEYNLSKFTTFIRFLPAHLSPLDGHYGYKSSMDEYNGVCLFLA